MAEPLCVVVGAGRIAGGFVCPILRACGWRVVLLCRSPDVRAAVADRRGHWLHFAGEPDDIWIDGVTALALDDPGVAGTLDRADLVATAVGPSSVTDVGRYLGPWLEARVSSGRPVNVIAFENHRRAQELLTLGLLESCPRLAPAIGRSLGISAGAVWRTVSRREITAEGLRFTADRTERCHVDAASLIDGAAPADGSLAPLELVRDFDNRVVEKLWMFNAGHAAAAYLGWHAGFADIAETLADPTIRAATTAVVTETQQAFDAYLTGRHPSAVPPHTPAEVILAHYAHPALLDPVVRVGREPRRKLAADDRLIGPATACLGAGIVPDGLAQAAAAALAYREPTDRQAMDLGQEIQLVGPAEVISAVATLDRTDDFVRLTLEHYDRLQTERASA